MKVQMKSRISGTRNGQSWPDVGEVINLPDAEAVDLLNAGLAQVPGEDEGAPVTRPAPKATKRAPKAKA